MNINDVQKPETYIKYDDEASFENRKHLLLSRHSLIGQATTFWSDKPLMLNKSLPHRQRLGPNKSLQKGSSASEKNKHLNILPESSGSVNLSFYSLENMSSQVSSKPL